MTRRLAIALPLVLLAFGCRSGRDFTFLGYSTKPLHDESIRTVYVPVFKNLAFQTTPNREMEADITRALIREIEQRTRMKVVSDRSRADTELLGTLVNIRKGVVNTNQQNLTREAEITATVNVVWRDLRDGRVLSNRRPVAQPDAPVPFDPSLPPPEPVAVHEKAIPAQVVAVGRVVPELGESNATANQSIANQLAKQIVNMMESNW
jgi:Lipopolysaccharide-assembly